MGDIHQRQKELKGWDQSVISGLTCLVLGVGGLGTTISANLCRLGVKTIIMVDMDTVDTHNLNRQILYKHVDVGLPKVTQAEAELHRHHNVSNCELRSYNIDALKEWKVIVNLIKESDIIFNSIDHGDYFDIAVCQIARRYNKPLVLGGTEPYYGHTISYFLQGTREGIDPTYLDCHDISEVDGKWNQSMNFEDYEDITFLPKDVHPDVGGSTVYSAGTCSHLMTCAIVNYLFHLKDSDRPDPPKQMIFNLLTMESTSWFSTTNDEQTNK